MVTGIVIWGLAAIVALAIGASSRDEFPKVPERWPISTSR